MVSNKYKIKAKVWLWPKVVTKEAQLKGRWHFVSLPKKESKEIKDRFELFKRGWGSLKVNVAVGKTKWATSIFPDKKLGTYVLPLKKDIRAKEDIKNKDTVELLIEVLV